MNNTLLGSSKSTGSIFKSFFFFNGERRKCRNLFSGRVWFPCGSSISAATLRRSFVIMFFVVKYSTK